MKQNPCPYKTCIDHKKNDCNGHQIEVCVKLREEYKNSVCRENIGANGTKQRKSTKQSRRPNEHKSFSTDGS